MKFIKDYINIFSGKADLEDKNILYKILYLLPFSMMGASFYYNNPVDICKGLWGMVLANDVFLTDYIYVSGVGPALFNSGLITFLIILLLKKLNLKPNGLIISAIYITAGFAFIGKNIHNIWPFYIGGYLYSVAKRITYKSIVITCIFSASLAPVVSVATYMLHNTSSGILLGYIIGIAIGYIMPSVSNHMLKVHSGYTVYNTGFAAGFIGAFANALFNSFGYNITPVGIHSNTSYSGLVILFLFHFTLITYIGLAHNGHRVKGYTRILSYPGRLVTDYTKLVNYRHTLINMGIMGFVGFAYITLMGGILSGSTIAGLLTLVGFAALGLNPNNTIPLMIGVTLASFLLKVDIHHLNIISIGLFASGLAPICGEYGALTGILVGASHLLITLHTGQWHSGMNLYNNGFSSGIVAMLFIPVLNALQLPKYNREDYNE